MQRFPCHAIIRTLDIELKNYLNSRWLRCAYESCRSHIMGVMNANIHVIHGFDRDCNEEIIAILALACPVPR